MFLYLKKISKNQTDLKRIKLKFKIQPDVFNVYRYLMTK